MKKIKQYFGTIIALYSHYQKTMRVRLIFLLVFHITISAHAQRVQDIVYNLVGLNPHDTINFPDPNKRAIIKDFWTCIKALDLAEQEQRKLNGRISFGFNSDRSDNQSLYRIDGGINGSRGIYPGELNFTSNIGILLNNGQFTENVSNIYMSYNYHPSWGDGLLAENYAFLKRFTDAYLGVDQRYELGGGIVIASYSKHLIDSSHINAINKVKFNADDFSDDIWAICSEHCALYKTEEVTKGDVKCLEKTQKIANLSHRKTLARYRLGLLIGMFFETEKINVSKLINFSTGQSQYNYSFEPTQRLRITIRPTFDYRPSRGITFKVRPYFKLPIPGQDFYNVSFGNIVDKKYDYRFDFETSLVIGIDNFLDTQNKSVSVAFVNNLFYDNAPSRLFITDPGNQVPILFSANKFHNMFSFMFRVDF